MSTLLQEPFSEQKFKDFISALLPDFELTPTRTEERRGFEKVRQIGESKSLDLVVFDVEPEATINARIDLAKHSYALLKNHPRSHALIAYHTDGEQEWRFSLITTQVQRTPEGVKETVSNPRRFSYVLGPLAKVKTPEKFLINEGQVSDFDNLVGRFSLEVVNKEFYLKIAESFDELVKQDEGVLVLPFQSDDTVRKAFAMRLIGRLVFCWFLKQKRSSQGQLIPDAILSSVAVTNLYYHSTLEPLFFEVLNTPIDARDIRSEHYDQVPYLNGGLFSPQADDYYELERTTFTSRHINTLKVADAWFKKFFGLLETYNFTIDENTIFDQELSVDPEMLGRIFENLLAEMNPDTGNSERKRTGSFYTPRQIVEYMVDQSLLEFLKTKTGIEEKRLTALLSYDLDDDELNPRTDEDNRKIVQAIEFLRVLDPACGSGAFPIGALQKIVWVLQRVDPDCKLWLERKLAGVPDLYKQKIINEVQTNPFDYTRKLDVIKNSIFGVDIQSIAVEISRLRCFLTLVVESEIHENKPNRGIEPLPNLDFKFVCANTLIGLPKTEEKGLFEDHSGIEQLSAIMSEYFSCSNQRKSEMRLRFTNAQKEILNKTLRQFGSATGDLTVKLTLWDPFSSSPSPWFDPEWMFGVESGFDLVIGNPPYVKKEHLAEETVAILESAYTETVNGKTKHWSDDLYVHFIFRGLELVREGGLLTYITNDSFVGLGSKERVRSLMFVNDLLSLVRCPSETFEATIYTAVFLLRKSKSQTNKYSTGYFEYPTFEYKDLGQTSYEASSALPGKRLVYANPLMTLFARLSSGKKVADFLNILDTGIHSGNVRSKVFFAENTTGTLHRMIQGKQINRWGIYWDAPGAKYKYCNIDYVPSAQKGIGRGGKQSKLEEWWRVGDLGNHHQPERLLMRQTDDDLVVAYQNEKQTGRLYTDNTLFTIFPKSKSVSLKYAMAVLNSRLLNSIYHLLSQEEGKTLAQVKVKLVSELPFVVGREEEIVALVDEILSLSMSDGYLNDSSMRERVARFEEQIDELIMDIYQLSDSEKCLVRGA